MLIHDYIPSLSLHVLKQLKGYSNITTMEDLVSLVKEDIKYRKIYSELYKYRGIGQKIGIMITDAIDKYKLSEAKDTLSFIAKDKEDRDYYINKSEIESAFGG